MQGYQSTGGEKAPLLPSSSPEPLPPPPNLFERLIQPCLVEFFGTTIFVFITTMTQQNELLLANAIGHGLCVGLLVLTIGRISGGHFNPAVSVAYLLSGGLHFIPVLIYSGCQFAGGLLGSALTRGCLSFYKQVPWLPPSNGTVYEQILGGAMTLQKGVDPGTGILTEMLCTLLVVITYLMATLDTKTKAPTAGLAIAFAIVVSVNAGGGVTKAAMNPVRAFAPAILISDLHPEVWDDHYVYWLGPFMGAGLAALIYRFLFAAEDRRLLFKKRD